MSYSIMEALKELRTSKINEDFEEFIETTQYSNKPDANTKYVVRWVTTEQFDEEYPEHYFFGKDLEQLKADFKEFIKKHPLRKELEFAEIYGYDLRTPEEPYDGKLIVTLFDDNKWLDEGFIIESKNKSYIIWDLNKNKAIYEDEAETRYDLYPNLNAAKKAAINEYDLKEFKILEHDDSKDFADEFSYKTVYKQ